MKQTQLMTVEDCSGLTEEELKQMANTFGEKCQQAAKKTVEDAITAGTALLAMRSRVQDGDWLKWLGSNWNYTRQTAQTYVTLAVNVKRFTSRTPDSIREAMRLIVDQKSEEDKQQETPRSERKTGRVEVVKSEPDEPGQQSVQPDENAVPPEPKTNTKHSKETARVKEADRPAPMKVTPEIIDEPEREDIDPKTLSDFGLDEIFEFIETVAAQDEKAFAKKLRKLADKLDPPTKFVKPTVEEVAAYCHEQGYTSVDAEDFVAYYGSQGWKKSNGQKLTDWRGATRTFNNNQKGSKHGNGKQSAAQTREQANVDAFAQLRLASGQQ